MRTAFDYAAAGTVLLVAGAAMIAFGIVLVSTGPILLGYALAAVGGPLITVACVARGVHIGMTSARRDEERRRV